MAFIVCIDGNIAAGKTTVLQEIEKKGYPVYYEPFSDNPWLPLYYQNPKKYALNTQLWFLSSRFKQYKNADFSTRKIVFVERSIYTDRFVFVELIKQQGNLDELEVDTYKYHFEICKNPLPDLTIVLDTPPTECKERMTVRGRGMEEGGDRADRCVADGHGGGAFQRVSQGDRECENAPYDGGRGV